MRLVILIATSERETLEKEADQIGLPLSSYCRMIILKSLQNRENGKNGSKSQSGG